MKNYFPQKSASEIKEKKQLPQDNSSSVVAGTMRSIGNTLRNTWHGFTGKKKNLIQEAERHPRRFFQQYSEHVQSFPYAPELLRKAAESSIARDPVAALLHFPVYAHESYAKDVLKKAASTIVAKRPSIAVELFDSYRTEPYAFDILKAATQSIDKNDLESVFMHFGKYSSMPYAQEVLENAVNTAIHSHPDLIFSYIDIISLRLHAENLVIRAIRQLLAKEDFETILSNTPSYVHFRSADTLLELTIRTAAEKDPEAVLKFFHIFKNAPYVDQVLHTTLEHALTQCPGAALDYADLFRDKPYAPDLLREAEAQEKNNVVTSIINTAVFESIMHCNPSLLPRENKPNGIVGQQRITDRRLFPPERLGYNTFSIGMISTNFVDVTSPHFTDRAIGDNPSDSAFRNMRIQRTVAVGPVKKHSKGKKFSVPFGDLTKTEKPFQDAYYLLVGGVSGVYYGRGNTNCFMLILPKNIAIDACRCIKRDPAILERILTELILDRFPSIRPVWGKSEESAFGKFFLEPLPTIVLDPDDMEQLAQRATKGIDKKWLIDFYQAHVFKPQSG